MEVVSAEQAALAAAEVPEEETSTVGVPQSPLSFLQGKRKELDKHLFYDLCVPRWDKVLGGHRLWVRYKAADPNALFASVQKREDKHAASVRSGGKGDPERVVKGNADVLVNACLAIYILGPNEEPPSDDLPSSLETLTFSSEELSDLVDAPHTAVDTVRKVYATDGDLMTAAQQLLDWSGQVSPKADSDFLAG